MRLLKEASAVCGALVVIALIAAFVAPKRTHALVAALVQVVPGTTTHLGQNESQLVSLACTQVTTCVAIDPFGNYSKTAYVVPSGYTLIVTDWQWTVSGATPGVRWADHFYTVNNLGIIVGEFLAYSYATPDQNGDTYAHEHYVTGIRLGSGQTIVDGRANDGTGSALIQGYLVPND